MKKVLTVVIPTYNMEKYLENCLNSFIFDEKEEGLEVLIVNDGSKDNSINIAKEYEKKYPNIFKIVDKENGGHGSTINAGLKVATGKYFKVVDADDWVETNQFKLLFEELKKLDADCVVCNYYHVFEQSNKKKFINCLMSDYNMVTPIKSTDKFKFYMAATTFKTEIIKDVVIDEKCFYVDVEYNELCTSRCKTFINLDLNVYRYRIGRAGQSVSIAGFYKHREDHYRVIKTLLNNISNNSAELIILGCCDTIMHHYSNYISIYSIDKATRKELIEFDNFLKNYPDLYKRTNEIRKIRNLRKKNFRNIAFYNRLFKMKQFVKKILGRA